jgi:hypothetical protein
MSPLIALLDTLGRRPAADPEAALAALPLAAPLQAALRARDPEALGRAFGASATWWCYVNSPEDEPQPAEDAPGDAPAEQPDEVPERAPEG